MENSLEKIQSQLKKLEEDLQHLASLVRNGQKELLSSADVMEMLNISRTSLYRLRDEGILNAYKVMGKIYFRRSEVLASIDEHLRPTG